VIQPLAGLKVGGESAPDPSPDPARERYARLPDLAVMLADDGKATSDISALTDQPRLHGPVASGTTAWRVLAAAPIAVIWGLSARTAQRP
jgi:hypothetical protein